MGSCISICFDDDENDNPTKKNRSSTGGEPRRSIPNRPIQQQRKEPIKRMKTKEKIVTDHSRNNNNNSSITYNIGNDNYEQYKQLNTHSRNNSNGNDNYEYYKQQQQSPHYPIKPYDLNNSSSIARINETNKAASSSVILSTLNFNTTPNGNGVKAGLTKEDKLEIAFLYKMASVNTTAASNTTVTDDEFRDNLNNLYLTINDNTNGNTHGNDSDITASNDTITANDTHDTHDVANKKVLFKTEKELKTEKVLRNIHLQYSDISPSPLKGNDNVNDDIVSKYRYNVELENKKKRNSVKNMQLERLSSARMTIPDNISFVDKS